MKLLDCVLIGSCVVIRLNMQTDGLVMRTILSLQTDGLVMKLYITLYNLDLCIGV